jgi:hypothetical protein
MGRAVLYPANYLLPYEHVIVLAKDGDVHRNAQCKRLDEEYG